MTLKRRLGLACAVVVGVARGSLTGVPLAAATEPPPAVQAPPPGEKDPHEGHHPATAGAPTAAEATQRPQIPDRVLIDQDGRRHRFYTDLVKGKLVVMNSIFTTCAATCPVQTAVFAQVQRLLGDRPGRDVQMLSVSLDPVTDTPARLKEFAERYGVRPGWLFLTGSREDVTEVLQAMDLYSAVPKEHTPMAAVGHEPSGLWMKVLNLTAPGEIVSRLDHVETLGTQRLAHE